MNFNIKDQLSQGTNYQIEVDELSSSVTVTFTLSREEVECRIQDIENIFDESNKDNPQENLFPLGKVWWCVRCQGASSGVSVKAYTELDAGFGTCGLQAFSVSRGECSS
jgi:hypothetical protein